MALKQTEQPRRGWMVLSTPGILGVDVMNHDHDSAQEANHYPLYPKVYVGGSNVTSLPSSARILCVFDLLKPSPAASFTILRRRGALRRFSHRHPQKTLPGDLAIATIGPPQVIPAIWENPTSTQHCQSREAAAMQVVPRKKKIFMVAIAYFQSLPKASFLPTPSYIVLPLFVASTRLSAPSSVGDSASRIAQ